MGVSTTHTKTASASAGTSLAPLSTMAPLAYKDLGKKAKDLLNKNYNTNTKLEVKTKTSDGLAFTFNGARNNDSLKTAADLTVKYTDKENGLTVEGVHDSDNKTKLVLSVEDTLADGLTLSVEAQTVNSEPRSILTGLEYKADCLAAKADVDFLNGMAVGGSAVFSYDGFALGVDGAYHIERADITKVNAALQYSTKEFIVTTAINAKGEKVAASYIHYLPEVAPAGASVSGDVQHDRTKKTNVFTIGGQYNYDKSCFVKAKANSDGIFSVLFQSQLRSNADLSIGSQIDTTKLATAGSHKIGLQLCLSD